MECIYFLGIYLSIGIIAVALAIKFGPPVPEGEEIDSIHIILSILFWPLLILHILGDVLVNGFYWIE